MRESAGGVGAGDVEIDNAAGAVGVEFVVVVFSGLTYRPERIIHSVNCIAPLAVLFSCW